MKSYHYVNRHLWGIQIPCEQHEEIQSIWTMLHRDYGSRELTLATTKFQAMSRVQTKLFNFCRQIAIIASSLRKTNKNFISCKHKLTMAMSWELLAWAIPKILVVCITSTEKLGSQLAIRDPVEKCIDLIHYQEQTLCKVTLPLDCLQICNRLTIKVEEMVVLVDMWSSISSSSYRTNVVFHAPTLLLASRLAAVPTDVQGCTTCRTGGVLL